MAELATPAVATFRQLVIRALIALPIAFVCWHYGAGALASLLAAIVDVVRSWLFLNIVSPLEVDGATVIFPVKGDRAAFAGKASEVLIEVNSRLYTYGLPVFVALMVAVRAKPWHAAVGLFALIPFQLWGVVFELLKNLAIPSVQGLPAMPRLGGLAREFIAVGYQLGVLIFPMVVPLTLVGVLNSDRLAPLLVSADGAQVNQTK